MQKMKLGAAAVLALGLAACNQGDSGNVMAPNANALDADDVNAALGPELANSDANVVGAAAPANDVDATDSPRPDDVESAPTETAGEENAVESNEVEQSQ